MSICLPAAYACPLPACLQVMLRVGDLDKAIQFYTGEARLAGWQLRLRTPCLAAAAEGASRGRAAVLASPHWCSAQRPSCLPTPMHMLPPLQRCWA